MLQGEFMPNSKQTFHINNCNVTPNGNSAHMSRSGINNQPNQGAWKNNDNQYDYTITLPSAAWQVVANQPNCSSSLTFTVTKGNTSCTYELLTTAPIGASAYTLKRSDGTICKELGVAHTPQDPDVIIDA
jgi:hypothetical protein